MTKTEDSIPGTGTQRHSFFGKVDMKQTSRRDVSQIQNIVGLDAYIEWLQGEKVIKTLF